MKSEAYKTMPLEHMSLILDPKRSLDGKETEGVFSIRSQMEMRYQNEDKVDWFKLPCRKVH